ncbi:hypothetical protein SARC_08083 [Sphaeroforma arctica JP610]|uniref:Uncharacterized protein n=1 Tax=Sphaeroforma arctica JP610 TaxID=667725 RepID=A0A0L0FUC5_9EUKA|nr:hypothetical protein SARC_08083 [Sphaeroforma arctica JP610]KNC79528.1 hypothetical protein SARC_08083 [Sphaeroforma arctica JP610]|eukprot:XP_014153430.1 hypothetical protein SARC_08083 [Sphaeroforma arctica JP610]
MNTGEEKLDTEIEGPYVPSARVDEVIANSDQGTSSGVPSGRSQAISHENNLEYEDMNNGEEKLDAESDARVNEFSVKSNQDSSSGFPGENVQDTSLSTNLDNEDMNSGEETLDGQFSGEPLAQDNENSSNFPGEARGSEDLPGEASDSNNYPDGTGGSETFPGEASGTDKYSGDNSGTDSFPGDASDAVEYSGDDSGTDSFPGDANDAEEYSGDDSGTDSFPGDDSDADDFPGDDVSPNIDEIIFPGADEIISINDDFDGNQIDFDGSIDDFNKLFTVQPDNGRANDNSSSDVNKPMNNNNDNSSGFIPTTYTIAGDIATFDQQAQDTFVQNLSGVLNVTPSRIIVVSVNAGSVVVATSLDDDAKAAMDNLSEEQMSQLTDLGIESYDVGNGEVTVSAADSNSDTSAESINDDGGNNMAVIIGGAVAGAAALLLGAGAVGAVLWRRRKAEDDKRKLKVQWGDVEAPLSFTVGKDMDMDMMFDDPLIMDDAHMLAASGSV